MVISSSWLAKAKIVSLLREIDSTTVNFEAGIFTDDSQHARAYFYSWWKIDGESDQIGLRFS